MPQTHELKTTGRHGGGLCRAEVSSQTTCLWGQTCLHIKASADSRGLHSTAPRSSSMARRPWRGTGILVQHGHLGSLFSYQSLWAEVMTTILQGEKLGSRLSNLPRTYPQQMVGLRWKFRSYESKPTLSYPYCILGTENWPCMWRMVCYRLTRGILQILHALGPKEPPLAIGNSHPMSKHRME